MGKIFCFEEASQIMSFLLTRFASLQLDWATTTGHMVDRWLYPAICPPHKDGGIPLNVLFKDTGVSVIFLREHSGCVDSA